VVQERKYGEGIKGGTPGVKEVSPSSAASAGRKDVVLWWQHVLIKRSRGSIWAVGVEEVGSGWRRGRFRGMKLEKR
jgi:hypothetical protein